jgi:hypoxanthine phosphoribosyltransferase
MKIITLHDKQFVPFIEEKQILEISHNLALQIRHDLAGKRPLFIVVLNGAFLFAADLFRYYDADAEITFLRVSSYQGTQSSGEVKQVMDIPEDVTDRDVVLIEDIIDSGLTIKAITANLRSKGAASIKVATLLFKPEAYREELHIDYIGFRVANDFLVGYGLDYNGLGRNIRGIYKLATF